MEATHSVNGNDSVPTLPPTIAGLASRVQRGAFDLQFMLPLAIAVFIGGYIGAHLGAFRLKAATMERLLGIIVLVAIILLVRQLLV